MKNKVDRRVVKTKRAIFTAFVDLLSEKEISSITITDIAKRAEINRKTFYNYYSNIYEVMDEIENITIEAFKEKLDAIEFDNMSDFLTELFTQFTHIINNDPDFYSHLFNINYHSVLIMKIITTLKESIKMRIQEKHELDLEKFNLIANFCVPGILSVYMDWFLNHQDSSIEELSSMLTQLILNGSLSIL